jgi:DNA-binding PadR family transcriptional regulator
MFGVIYMHHDPFVHAAGRRAGRHGLGRWLPGAFDGSMGGSGFPGGRKLGAPDLQLLLLLLLEEQPAHGYELSRILEERSAGFYTPSPGMVYPALSYLEDIGHASVSQDGNRKLYQIADPGRLYLNAHRDQAKAILDALANIGGRMARVRRAFWNIDDADPTAADGLHDASRALKTALLNKAGCTADEARRISRILTLATAQIVTKPA